MQRLAEDPSASSELRQLARRELAAMDADGKINGHYLAVKAAAIELNELDQSQPTPELARAAQAAIARVTNSGHRSKDATGAETRTDSDAAASSPRPAVKRYGLRAFLAALEEMDGWWQHYEPQQIAAGLSEEQWQRFCAHLDASNNFGQMIAAARAGEARGIEQRSRAARS